MVVPEQAWQKCMRARAEEMVPRFWSRLDFCHAVDAMHHGRQFEDSLFFSPGTASSQFDGLVMDDQGHGHNRERGLCSLGSFKCQPY